MHQLAGAVLQPRASCLHDRLDEGLPALRLENHALGGGGTSTGRQSLEYVHIEDQ